jgi:hypothetical protein
VVSEKKEFKGFEELQEFGNRSQESARIQEAGGLQCVA